MLLLICLALAIVFSLALKPAIKAVPWLFYVIAIAVDVLIIFSGQLDLPPAIWKSLVLVNGRALFAFGLFVVVMFIGVLKNGSKLKEYLLPIRAELSIIAAILIVGHIVRYINVYSVRVLTNPNSVANGMLVSFAVAAIITILLVVLTVTSFKVVKKAMDPKVWKKVQMLAYPFFGLIYVHIFLIMMRSAMRGAEGAMISLVLYGIITVAYIVLRVLRYKEDQKAVAAPTAEVAA